MHFDGKFVNSSSSFSWKLLLTHSELVPSLRKLTHFFSTLSCLFMLLVNLLFYVDFRV